MNAISQSAGNSPVISSTAETGPGRPKAPASSRERFVDATSTSWNRRLSAPSSRRRDRFLVGVGALLAELTERSGDSRCRPARRPPLTRDDL